MSIQVAFQASDSQAARIAAARITADKVRSYSSVSAYLRANPATATVETLVKGIEAEQEFDRDASEHLSDVQERVDVMFADWTRLSLESQANEAIKETYPDTIRITKARIVAISAAASTFAAAVAAFVTAVLGG